MNDVRPCPFNMKVRTQPLPNQTKGHFVHITLNCEQWKGFRSFPALYFGFFFEGKRRFSLLAARSFPPFTPNRTCQFPAWLHIEGRRESCGIVCGNLMLLIESWNFLPKRSVYPVSFYLHEMHRRNERNNYVVLRSYMAIQAQIRPQLSKTGQ